MGKFFSFVHMGKSYISKVPIGPEVSKTNLGTGPGPCKKCGLGPGPGGPLIAALGNQGTKEPLAVYSTAGLGGKTAPFTFNELY